MDVFGIQWRLFSVSLGWYYAVKLDLYVSLGTTVWVKLCHADKLDINIHVPNTYLD